MKKIIEIFDLFESQGLVEYEMNFNKNGINFIGRGAENNGVVNTVEEIQNLKPLKGNCLTVAMGGSVMECFLQEEPFYSSFHIKILRPKEKMTINQLFFYCTVIRMNKWKYNFGRQANKTIKDILVPDLKEIPEWVNNYKFSFNLDRSSANTNKISLNQNEWRYFNIYPNIFEISASKDDLILDYDIGHTPYISSTAFNNGVVKFADSEPTNSKGTITINRGGSWGEAFYQDKDYLATPVDVRILTPKKKINVYIGLFISLILRKEKFRFNYSRKMGTSRLKELRIKLPSTENNEPDYSYMENYIKSLPYSSNLAKYAD
jgi:hypothetical protein